MGQMDDLAMKLPTTALPLDPLQEAPVFDLPVDSECKVHIPCDQSHMPRAPLPTLTCAPNAGEEDQDIWVRPASHARVPVSAKWNATQSSKNSLNLHPPSPSLLIPAAPAAPL